MQSKAIKSSHYSVRPFHIFDERQKKDLRWRYYATKERAIEKCVYLTYELKVGNVFTVYDCNSGRAHRQFKRTATEIKVLK